MHFSNYFKGKKITVMGLGLLGRGLGDVKFLAEEGAELIVTDLKTKEQLASSLEKLSQFKNITYVLGEHRLEDFRNRDMILKAAGVPLDSPFISEARKNNIPIEMDASLFAKFAEGAVLIGVTGTRGKTTTTTLIYEIAKARVAETAQKVFLAGNIRDTATLPLVREVKAGDIVVLELDSWQLQGFGEAKISPHISVFTNFMDDHLNYYHNDIERYLEDKAQIFLHQKQNDYLITGEKVAHLITAKYFGRINNTLESVGKDAIPKEWKLKVAGEHNKENVALALRVGKILGLSYEKLREVVEDFNGVAGRLEFIREVNGVKIYNDTTGTTPDATSAGLEALSLNGKNPVGQAKNKNVILIFGGADKGIDMSKLFSAIKMHAKAVIMLYVPGKTSGSERVKTDFDKLDLKKDTAENFAEALQKAFAFAVAGDTILMSPAFASFGMFKNEYDRGDHFNQAVRDLK